MAHTCPECYQYCTCHGDIDDIDFGDYPMCLHCPADGIGEDDDLFPDDDDAEQMRAPDGARCSSCGFLVTPDNRCPNPECPAPTPRR